VTPKKRRKSFIDEEVRPIQIARELDVSPTLVYRVIDDLATSDRVQRAIAKAIKKPVEEVFPTKYPTRRPGPRRVEPMTQCAAS